MLKSIRQFIFITAILFSFFASSSMAQIVSAAGDESDDEIRINTEMGQIILAVEQTIPEPFRFEVKDNGVSVSDVTFDAPGKNNPLHLAIIVALNSSEKFGDEKYNLLNEFKNLKENLDYKLAQVNLVQDSEGLYKKVKFPGKWDINNRNDVSEAVQSSLDSLRKIPNSSRKAILMITNDTSSLPYDVIDKTDAALGKQSAMVYIMSVVKQKNKRSRIAMCNINGNDIVLRPTDYVGGLFRSFTRLARNMYTVSYQIPDSDSSGQHRVEVSARRIRDNGLVALNIREFETNSSAGQSSQSIQFTEAEYSDKDKPTTAPALKAIEDLRNAKFEELLATRPAKLSAEVIKKYRDDLLKRPEMKNANVFKSDTKIVKQFKENIEPVLKLYGRDGYTDIVLYESDFPFIALYRECLIVISTKTLDVLNDKQLRGAVAHELAQEIFFDELKKAVADKNIPGQQVVEHKSDIVASMALEALKESPLLSVDAVQKQTRWYAKYYPNVPDEENHPASLERRKCVKTFIEIRKNPSKENIAVR